MHAYHIAISFKLSAKVFCSQLEDAVYCWNVGGDTFGGICQEKNKIHETAQQKSGENAERYLTHSHQKQLS